MIHDDRIRHLTAGPPSKGQFVLYWMQQAQRVAYNHALAFAADEAARLRLPLVVGFVVTSGFPEATHRHYRFMLEGIAETQTELAKHGIPFLVRVGEMVDTVAAMAEGAARLVTDVGYLRIQREGRRQVAQALRCPVTEVETDVVVPAATAADKAESAARTLRPKLLAKADRFLDAVDAPREVTGRSVARSPISPSDPIDPAALAERVCPEAGPPGKAPPETCPRKGSGKAPPESGPGTAAGDPAGPAPNPSSQRTTPLPYSGGPTAARRTLHRFIREHLSSYDTLSRDPATDCRSHLSPYLHFGQISPVEVVREIRNADAPQPAKDAFIEQVLVRRELAVNFVFYTDGYDRYDDAVPQWAKRTLADHEADPRPHRYTLQALEAGQTHDPFWNAAQGEMVSTGSMHNYMRMYWGKKIIEWTPDPREAFRVMQTLNNRYELDGRDPNGFAGIAWCFGRHDRGWPERAVFGKVRYMNAAGLKRKFRMEEYVARHLPGAFVLY